MIISHEFLEIRRKAENGCIDSMLTLVDCFGEGYYGIEKNDDLYLRNALKLLGHLDEIRDSKFSSSQIFYQLVYVYLEQGNNTLAGYYLEKLLWELLFDYPNNDLEEILAELKIRELGDYLNIDLEDDIKNLKEGQSLVTRRGYKIIDVNDFLTN